MPFRLFRLSPWLCLSASLLLGASAFSAGLDVRSFGAKGDGITFDTTSINACIEAAAKAGGGTVEFPAGRYLSYSIRLRSHVTLHFQAGATLVAAEPSADLTRGYDAPEANPGTDQYQDFGHSHWHNSLIWGEDLEDVAIEGHGLIFGKGLSNGSGVSDPLPEGRSYPRPYTNETPLVKTSITPGPFKYPNSNDALPAGVGNKAIALKNCRNVTLRDFSLLHGGHFGLLLTGVDNLTVDNLKIDTNRDGIDIDCCSNVRVSNCSVNSPIDDGICLKASYALGRLRPTENVTITNCLVSGYDEGSLLDGTRKKGPCNPGGPYGRIKLGTEASSGFRNITISNCVFEHSRGLALEQVDGSFMEDICVSNLTMRDIANAPVFVRLGARLRSPGEGLRGSTRRIQISNIVASDVSPEAGILVLGLPGNPIEELELNNIQVSYRGGGTAAQAGREVPELEKAYPEPSAFGTLPSWGLFARHVSGLRIHNLRLSAATPDKRPALWLEDAGGCVLDNIRCVPGTDAAPLVLRNAPDLTIQDSPQLTAGRQVR